MEMLRIGVVTGGRADYGVLLPILRLLRDAPDFELVLIVTGSHLAPEFGYTVSGIEADGFTPDARLEALLSSDSPVGTAKSMGLGVLACADAFDRLHLDLLLLMGDRFELLAAAQTATILRIPIAHIGGGHVTTGAYDDAIRHSITKLSHLHLTSDEQSRQRVIQLGEHPGRVEVTGSTALDLIRELPLLSAAELSTRLGFSFQPRNVLLTYHPVTLEAESSADQLRAILAALDDLPEVGVIFTRPNQDDGSRKLSALIDEFARDRGHTVVHSSLGQQAYLSAMRAVDAVVGNSSSGLFEAPFLRRPTVNVGNRQRGRTRAASVIDCEPTRAAVRAAVQQAFELDCSQVWSPFGDGRSAPRTLDALRRHRPFLKSYLGKEFFDLASSNGAV